MMKELIDRHGRVHTLFCGEGRDPFTQALAHADANMEYAREELAAGNHLRAQEHLYAAERWTARAHEML